MNTILIPHVCARCFHVKRPAAWSLALGCLLLTFGTVGLSSCGTAHGFGHDVERVGDEIQEHVPPN